VGEPRGAESSLPAVDFTSAYPQTPDACPSHLGFKNGYLVVSYGVTLRHAIKDSRLDFFLWIALRFIPSLASQYRPNTREARLDGGSVISSWKLFLTVLFSHTQFSPLRNRLAG